MPPLPLVPDSPTLACRHVGGQGAYDLAVTQYHLDLPDVADVLQGVAAEDNEVGDFPWLSLPQAGLLTQELGG